MYYFYVLYSLKDHLLYKGFSANFPNRFIKHNAGGNKATAYRRPLILIHIEAFDQKKEAIQRGKISKSPKGNWLLKTLLRKKIFSTSKTN
jgi:putative endonuclease